MQIIVERLNTKIKYWTNNFNIPLYNIKCDNMISKTNEKIENSEAFKPCRKKKIAVTAGTFDLLHPGHYNTLKFAKSLADELVVIIARDKTVEKIKGRKPIIPEEQRVMMVEALKPVDKAILGSLNDKLEPILKIKPDVIVLGPDQTTYKVEELKKQLKKYNLNPEVVKVEEYVECPFHSSYDIIKEVIRKWSSKDICGNKWI